MAPRLTELVIASELHKTHVLTKPRGWMGLSPVRHGPNRTGGCPQPLPAPQFRQQLSDEELERLEEACDMALELNASKHRIYEYVESRMSFIAPNLSIIIGASTAAKIMGEFPAGSHGTAGRLCCLEKVGLDVRSSIMLSSGD